ncbi:actin interacting protein 3-domain-containing protein [Mycena rosella]|uniref:Actin interacting protein 3-domain-containing protein n=1 Tax=Mycena rosella TaxID=1033263 RepID=A0AAD7CXS3_MYCRO|nr:actin interacting protein 3-domain-containing protein [Mycena rosella]
MSNRTTLPGNPAPAGGTGSTSSRRDTNQSASSTHSASSRSERGGSRSAAHPAVESAVTRLLVAIKQLLEALTQWSLLKIDENNVSDVYVRLGNDFNAAVAAFAAFNIDMAELMTVPDDLRNVLEQCLAEDATPDNLELYLPTVRQIITNLLQGLRGKQSIYRRIVSDYRHRSEQSGSEKTENRTSRSRREGSHRSQLSRTTFSDNDTPPTPNSVLRDRDSASSRKSTQQSSSRRRDPSSPSLNGSSLNDGSTNGDSFVGGFAPTITEPPVDPQGEYFPQSDSLSRKARTVPPPIDPPPADSFQYPTNSPNEQTAMPLAAPNVPASVKRYSLVDRPLATPSVVVEPSSPDPDRPDSDQPDSDRASGSTSPPPPETPPIDVLQAPAMANSLAALKKSDTLERRASKRFSTYNISKMTGAPTMRERSTRTGLGAPNRRSLAASSAPTLGDLAVLTEVDDEEPAAPLLRRGSSRSRSSPSTPERRQPETPPIPPLPATPARTPDPVIPTPTAPSESVAVALPPAQPARPSRFIVFLQLGREVKKVTIDHGLSFPSLRVLFVDKFSYNPGLENFPAIYIRDPSSGVQYELEDMEEVKEKCLLSLNIEPLDQIKQHIDAQISNLSQDIKDLKTAVHTNNRQSMHAPPSIVGPPLAESTPAPNRPTDRQFQTVARRLSRFVGDSSGLSSFSAPTPMQPQMTGQSLQPQMTGGSMLSDYSSRVVTDLKTQFDEVQNLRRDLGIMRQLYTEFMKSTKESLGTLRGQTQSVKQLASTSVGGARGYIDTGKKKLDTRSQNVLTEVEKLQDTVEGVKDDVIKRHITPKAQYFRNIKKDIDTVAAEMASLKEHINTIKPMWKKTWEEELQNIVDEQGFLTHQEQFLEDLLEDHKALVEVYGHVEKIISIRGPGSVGSRGGKRGFRPPPPPEEGHGGLSNVMLEIRGASVDPERRMKAIEASQKSREKELASRSDEMQAELSDFVAGKKLKMTGGAEEAERVRQKRSDMTLKAMFNGGVTDMGPDSPG